MSGLEGGRIFFLKPAEIIFASLLGQIRCAERSTGLNENVKVSKPFSDLG